MSGPGSSPSTGPDQGEWWTRIRLPDGVQCDVYHGAGSSHVCLFGPSRKAIEDALRGWADHPFFEFDPPKETP